MTNVLNTIITTAKGNVVPYATSEGNQLEVDDVDQKQSRNIALILFVFKEKRNLYPAFNCSKCKNAQNRKLLAMTMLTTMKITISWCC